MKKLVKIWGKGGGKERNNGDEMQHMGHQQVHHTTQTLTTCNAPNQHHKTRTETNK